MNPIFIKMTLKLTLINNVLSINPNSSILSAAGINGAPFCSTNFFYILIQASLVFSSKQIMEFTPSAPSN